QDSRSSTLRAPSDSSSFRVADASNRGSHDSIEMKKASSVTRSKTLDWKRMMVHGQPVQTEHAEHRAERSEENSHLERDRNVGRPREVRFAADDEGVRAV